MSPNTARHSAASATEKRRWRKNSSLSIGWALAGLPEGETSQDNQTGHSRPRDGPRRPPPGRALDDRPQQKPEAGDRQSGTEGIGALLPPGLLRAGNHQHCTEEAMNAIGTFTENIDPHQNLDSRSPPAMGPIAIPSPIVPAQTPTARARRPGSWEDVVDDRQRCRDVKCGTRSHEGPKRDKRRHRARQRRPYRPQSEHGDSDQEEPLTTEPVGQCSSDEQQACKHNGVRVDDPLQLAGRGLQVSDERGKCDVEDGVVDVDDQRRKGTRSPGPTVGVRSADRASTRRVASAGSHT